MSMNEDDGFEQELRGSLGALAQQSPAGPTADGVLGALHARSARRQRLGAAGGIALAVVAVAAWVLQREGSNETDKQQVAVSNNVQSPLDANNAATMPQPVTGTQADSQRLFGGAMVETDAGNWPAMAWALSLLPDQDEKEGSLLGWALATPDWNVSLRLTLASSAMEGDGSPIIRFTTPW